VRTRVKVAVLGVVVASVSACGNGTERTVRAAPRSALLWPASAPALPANAVKGRLHTHNHLDQEGVALDAPDATVVARVSRQTAFDNCVQQGACVATDPVVEVVLTKATQDSDSQDQPALLHAGVLTYLIVQNGTCVPHGPIGSAASPVPCTVTNYVNAITGEPIVTISGPSLPPLDVQDEQ
jgi:hypothetical protein